MPRKTSNTDNWEFGGAPPLDGSTPQPRSRMRRVAMTLAFTALFFSGAAITAVAGDQFSRLSAEDAAADSTTTDETTTEAAPAEAPAPADASAPAADPEAASAAASTPAADDASAAGDAPQAAAPEAADPAAPESAPQDESAAQPTQQASAPAGASAKGRSRASSPARIVLLPELKPAPQPELEGPESAATVWLNSALPDPTPPAKRLTPAFARQLTATAKGTGQDWALLLGVLRAKGATGQTPAESATLAKLANRLSDLHKDRTAWATALAYGGSSSFADRAVALMHYNRAVGLGALVHGLESAKNALGARLLADPQVSIYGAGREDVVRGRVDVRVLALIAYMRESFGEVTVSSLISGHRLYARPGVVSAHIYGHAVDFASLGGESVLGHQEPGGLTEHAVRDILLLPPEVMPRQVISLLGLGGPSFPMDNHYDHIHVGY